MKAAKMLFCIINLGICILVFGLFIFKKDFSTPLVGVTVDKPKPVFSIKSMMVGSFQHEYEDWLGENFPLRSFFIKGYDQIIYSFGGTVNDIQPGKKEDLHGKMWLNGYLMYDIDASVLEQYKNDLNTINQYLISHNKKLCYMLSPNKSEIYSDSMPWNYKLIEKNTQKPAQARWKIRNLLTELEIPYLDTADIMFDLKKNGKYQPFPKTGIHWNRYGSSIALNMWIKFLNERGFQVPQIQAEFDESETPDKSDTDYRDLLNVYIHSKGELYPHVKFTLDMSKEPEVKIYAMTTSYHTAFMEMFLENDMPFSKYKRLYYNQYQSLLIRDQNGLSGDLWMNATPFDQIDYSEIIDYDIFVIEHNAGELPEAHIDFIRRFAEYINSLN